jgi:hypothetical protein
MKEESMPPSSMLFGSAHNEEAEAEEAEDLLKITTQTMDLPTMSPMEQTSRTTSPSRQSTTLKPWDLS